MPSLVIISKSVSDNNGFFKIIALHDTTKVREKKKGFSKLKIGINYQFLKQNKNFSIFGNTPECNKYRK